MELSFKTIKKYIMMTIKDLKEQIKDLPNDMTIIIQKDAEGNGYSPLAGTDPEAVYIPHTTWYGKVYSTNWTASDSLMNEEEWKELLKKR